jgi:hypothetical protein
MSIEIETTTLPTAFGYGLEADRPASAAGHVAFHWYSTDTKKLSRDNGATWDDLGSSIYVSAVDPGAAVVGADAIWIDTASGPPYLAYVSNGATWDQFGGATDDDSAYDTPGDRDAAIAAAIALIPADDDSAYDTPAARDAAIAAIPVDGSAATPSLRTLGTGATQAAAGNHGHVVTDARTVVLDGGGYVLQTNQSARFKVPVGWTLTGVETEGDVSGSLVLSVKTGPWANPPVFTSICGANPPTITGAVASQDLTLTGWSPNITGGYWIEIAVVSCTLITKVSLALIHTKVV